MDAFEESYLKYDKKLKKYYDTLLLDELIFLNYAYSNNEYGKVTVKNIFDNLHSLEYSKKDINDIIDNALYLVKLKYNFDVNSFK